MTKSYTSRVIASENTKVGDIFWGLRISSYSQEWMNTHLGCFVPSLVGIHECCCLWTQRSNWQRVCGFRWKMMDFLTPSDLAHIHRVVRAHSGSDSNQVWMESKVIGWSYKWPKSSLFFSWKHTLSRDENFFHSSDLAHIHRAKLAHTRHIYHQIWMKSNAIHWSY